MVSCPNRCYGVRSIDRSDSVCLTICLGTESCGWSKKSSTQRKSLSAIPPSQFYRQAGDPNVWSLSTAVPIFLRRCRLKLRRMGPWCTLLWTVGSPLDSKRCVWSMIGRETCLAREASASAPASNGPRCVQTTMSGSTQTTTQNFTWKTSLRKSLGVHRRPCKSIAQMEIEVLKQLRGRWIHS